MLFDSLDNQMFAILQKYIFTSTSFSLSLFSLSPAFLLKGNLHNNMGCTKCLKPPTMTVQITIICQFRAQGAPLQATEIGCMLRVVLCGETRSSCMAFTNA